MIVVNIDWLVHGALTAKHRTALPLLLAEKALYRILLILLLLRRDDKVVLAHVPDPAGDVPTGAFTHARIDLEYFPTKLSRSGIYSCRLA